MVWQLGLAASERRSDGELSKDHKLRANCATSSPAKWVRFWGLTSYTTGQVIMCEPSTSLWTEDFGFEMFFYHTIKISKLCNLQNQISGLAPLRHCLWSQDTNMHWKIWDRMMNMRWKSFKIISPAFLVAILIYVHTHAAHEKVTCAIHWT